MVHQVDQMLQKLHVLVVGPGLGRCPFVMEATSQIITKALSNNILLQVHGKVLGSTVGSTLTSDAQPANKSPVILTPNAMEWQRLHGLQECWDQDRVVVVQKGMEDIIRYATTTTNTTTTSKTTSNDVQIPASERILHCREIGGLKRSGGIGDILAGTLGTILAWNNVLRTKGVATTLDVPLACWLACSVVKRATHVAYHHHYRAMTAPDVLHALGPTFHDMTVVNATSTTTGAAGQR